MLRLDSPTGKLSSLVSGLPILQALGLENVTTTNSDTGMSSKRVKYQSQVPPLNCFVTLSLKSAFLPDVSLSRLRRCGAAAQRD